MSYSLKLNYGNREVGMLSQDQDAGLLNLEYTSDWQENGFGISPALTLDNHHGKASAYNYMDNALPEGEARNLLVRELGISEKNLFPQIQAIGDDLSGAICFSNDVQDEKSAPGFRLITENELIKRLDHKEEFGLVYWDDKPRLSVAGVQQKLNVFIDQQGQIGFGEGALCSTHILKFETKSCPFLVINELFCMKLSKAIGLPTAAVDYMRLGDHPILVVTRYDRQYDPINKQVKRRHLFDGCQAIDMPRDYKYERNLGDGRDVKHIKDGVSLEKLFRFCAQTSVPIESTRFLINWQLFNLMINNFDSHGKNISWFCTRNRITPAPAYDLINIAMFDQFRHVLPMGMGDEFDPASINAYQLADFSESCSLDKRLVSRMLTELGNRVTSAIDQKLVLTGLLNQYRFSANEIEYLNVLAVNIRARTSHLLEQAQEMVAIEV